MCKQKIKRQALVPSVRSHFCEQALIMKAATPQGGDIQERLRISGGGKPHASAIRPAWNSRAPSGSCCGWVDPSCAHRRAPAPGNADPMCNDCGGTPRRHFPPACPDPARPELLLPPWAERQKHCHSSPQTPALQQQRMQKSQLSSRFPPSSKTLKPRLQSALQSSGTV